MLLPDPHAPHRPQPPGRPRPIAASCSDCCGRPGQDQDQPRLRLRSRCRGAAAAGLRPPPAPAPPGRLHPSPPPGEDGRGARSRGPGRVGGCLAATPSSLPPCSTPLPPGTEPPLSPLRGGNSDTAASPWTAPGPRTGGRRAGVARSPSRGSGGAGGAGVLRGGSPSGGACQQAAVLPRGAHGGPDTQRNNAGVPPYSGGGGGAVYTRVPPPRAAGRHPPGPAEGRGQHSDPPLNKRHPTAPPPGRAGGRAQAPLPPLRRAPPSGSEGPSQRARGGRCWRPPRQRGRPRLGSPQPRSTQQSPHGRFSSLVYWGAAGAPPRPLHAQDWSLVCRRMSSAYSPPRRTSSSWVPAWGDGGDSVTHAAAHHHPTPPSAPRSPRPPAPAPAPR